MGLNDFIAAKPRPLPIFLLADVSSSMHGEKINALNIAINEMISAFRKLDDIRAEIQLCILTFGGDVQVHTPLQNISEVQITGLEAHGNTPMGKAINQLVDIIENREIVLSRGYAPTIILISDGQPTDVEGELLEKLYKDEAEESDFLKWAPVDRMLNSPRAAKAMRLALGVGNDADHNMLKAFINNAKIPVMYATDAKDISKYFKLVTMSTISRVTSINPDNIDLVLPIFGDEPKGFKI